MSGIALFGEALVDFVVAADFGSALPVPGGSLYNTASSLAKLDQPVRFYTQVGDDLWGRRLLAEMESHGIDTSNIVKSRRNKTMLAFAAKDAAGNARYDFYRGEQAERFDFSGIETCGIFHFGSIASVFPENRKVIAHALAIARRAGMLVSYDPNFRPSYAHYKKTWLEHLTRADIVKASIDDVAALFVPESEPVNNPASGAAGLHGLTPEAALAVLDGLPASLVVVTLGEKGAIARIKGQKAVSVPGRTVPVVDTIGAGDNFSAGYLRFLHGRGIHTAAALRSCTQDDVAAMLESASDLACAALGVHGANVPKHLLINPVMPRIRH